MRPYLAIIKDSFRAALASRVLYVLLLLITVLLLALAPLFVRETLDWKLNRQANVRDPKQVIQRLVERRETSRSIKRIWELLPAGLKTQLVERVEGKAADENENDESNRTDGRRRRNEPEFARELRLQDEVIDELNTLIARRDFFREEDWNVRRLNTEVQELVGRRIETLSDVQVKRLNRLLISSAFAPAIEPGNPTALEIHYAIWTLPFPIPVSQQQFAQLLVTNLPYYFDKFVLSIGLLIAIVITANMVPDTFEPGSLNLLLSKPISRWGLFTAKFFGGCVFIALCAAYLFLGLWLWLGLGMGVWDRAMLYSIPLYVIVFAIYFAVSALVGLLFRSPIVSVILTLLFWVACFVVGTLYGIFNNKISNDERTALVPMDGKLLSCDLFQQVAVWNEATNQWDERQKMQMNREEEIGFTAATYFGSLRDSPEFSQFLNLIKPAFDRQNNRVLVSQMNVRSFGGFGKPLYVGSYDNLDFKLIGQYPDGTFKLVETLHGMVAATSSGTFLRLKSDAYDAAVAESAADSEEKASDKPPSQNRRKADELFESIGPKDPQFIERSEHVDYSYARNEFAAYAAGTIRVYQAEGNQYELRKEVALPLEFQKNMSALLAFGRRHIVIAFGNGKVFVVNADSLEKEQEFQLENRSGVRDLASSPDGRYFGVLFRNGNLWLADSRNQIVFNKKSIGNQGTIGAFAFEEKDLCWINYDGDRIAQYDLTSGSRILRYTPKGNFVSNLYRYLVRPLYRVFPKPGEFYKVVSHLASSGDASSNQNVDLIQNPTRESSDPWAPLRSGLVFMLAMLAAGCTVFHFKDY
jgi:ABC-type transport system involved in multi-copper enzyme maturation permease subunit